MSLTVVITGANRGIGLELARQYAADGAKVIAVVRCPSEPLQGLGVSIVEGIDVGQDVAVEQLGQQAATLPPIDVLINNAGILNSESLPAPDFDRMRQQFEVNALGPLRVTTALRPQLAAGSKVVLITSRMGSITDNSSGGMYGYRSSKAALNATADTSPPPAGSPARRTSRWPGKQRDRQRSGSGSTREKKKRRKRARPFRHRG